VFATVAFPADAFAAAGAPAVVFAGAGVVAFMLFVTLALPADAFAAAALPADAFAATEPLIFARTCGMQLEPMLSRNTVVSPTGPEFKNLISVALLVAVKLAAYSPNVLLGGVKEL